MNIVIGSDNQIQEADRCAQRFLCRENIKQNIDTYEMQVMIFGETCSCSIC